MVTKQTFVAVCDASGVRFIRTIHLYGGFKRHKSSVGYYIRGSVRLIKKKPKNPYLRKKFFKRGQMTRALLIRQTYPIVRLDGSSLRFNQNSSYLLKKKNVFYSRHTVGPAPTEVGKRRFILAFSNRL